MYQSLICVMVLINYSEAKFQHTDKPAIIFRYKDIPGTDFKVEIGKPLDIVLDNFFANYMWCLNFYYTGPEHQFVNHVFLNGNSDAVVNIPKVTEVMLTKWWCVILQDYSASNGKPYTYHGQKYTAFNLVFNLHDINTNDTTILDQKVMYIVLGILIIISLLICIIIMAKKWFCQKPKPLHFPVDPATVFYSNQILRHEFERELQEQEPVYEEI